jgi:hypothetical protein
MADRQMIVELLIVEKNAAQQTTINIQQSNGLSKWIQSG